MSEQGPDLPLNEHQLEHAILQERIRDLERFCRDVAAKLAGAMRYGSTNLSMDELDNVAFAARQWEANMKADTEAEGKPK